MVIPFKRHEAFSFTYNGVVRELITPVQLMAPSLTHPFSPVNNMFACDALWDTGATGTVITKVAAETLGLAPTGIIKSVGVHGSKMVNTYLLDILLPNNVLFPNINVCEGDLGEKIAVLIGMDIIQAGDFAISNAQGVTRFSYCFPPHSNPIDLVEKSNRVNEKIDKKNRWGSK